MGDRRRRHPSRSFGAFPYITVKPTEQRNTVTLGGLVVGERPCRRILRGGIAIKVAAVVNDAPGGGV